MNDTTTVSGTAQVTFNNGVVMADASAISIAAGASVTIDNASLNVTDDSTGTVYGDGAFTFASSSGLYVDGDSTLNALGNTTIAAGAQLQVEGYLNLYDGQCGPSTYGVAWLVVG
jgi:hypothetical protein